MFQTRSIHLLPWREFPIFCFVQIPIKFHMFWWNYHNVPTLFTWQLHDVLFFPCTSHVVPIVISLCITMIYQRCYVWNGLVAAHYARCATPLTVPGSPMRIFTASYTSPPQFDWCCYFCKFVIIFLVLCFSSHALFGFCLLICLWKFVFFFFF